MSQVYFVFVFVFAVPTHWWVGYAIDAVSFFHNTAAGAVAAGWTPSDQSRNNSCFARQGRVLSPSAVRALSIVGITGSISFAYDGICKRDRADVAVFNFRPTASGRQFVPVATFTGGALAPPAPVLVYSGGRPTPLQTAPHSLGRG